MNGLISFENFSLTPTQNVSREILELNEISGEWGLVLTEEEALFLAETRGKALADNDRIEVGVGAVAEIIKRFSQSRYINQEDYAWIIGEITELFYFIKTETEDKISDGELLDELFNHFELHCRGSIEILVGREAESIILKIKNDKGIGYGVEDGYEGDTSRDTPEAFLRGEYDESLWSEDDDLYLEDETYDADEEDICIELDPFGDGLEKMSINSFHDFWDALAVRDMKNDLPTDDEGKEDGQDE